MSAWNFKKKYRRVVQLELNEISHFILRKLLQKGKLPHFAQVLSNWKFLETTSEERYEHIEPWIQWVSAHTGKSYNEHGIFHLGDVHELQHPQVWEVLSQKGMRSAVLGAMNASRGETSGGIFFPDPWSKKNEAFPQDLQSLWQIVSGRVQSHYTTQPKLSEILSAIKTCRRFDVSPATMARIAKQVVTQRFDHRAKWRLVGLFDLFLSDMFIHVLKNGDCQFNSLFLNSVAHYQHHFWRQFDRSAFAADIDCPDCHPSDDPIAFGYELFDEVLGKILRNIDLNDTLVVIASGLTQVPDTRFEAQGGMNYYRLRDHKQFATLIGLPAQNIFPLMSRDWQVHLDQSNNEEHCRDILAAVRLEKDPLFTTHKAVDGYLFVETAVTRRVGAEEKIFFGDRCLGTFEGFFANTAVKSGHHSGLGNLWLSCGEQESVAAKNRVPVTELFDLSLSALS